VLVKTYVKQISTLISTSHEKGYRKLLKSDSAACLSFLQMRLSTPAFVGEEHEAFAVLGDQGEL
jgi:hypothetical protein